MPDPRFKLRDAYEDEKRVTVIETNDTMHKEYIVDDFMRAKTDQFEVWRFVLRDLYGEKTLYGPDLQSVEILDGRTDD